MKELSVFVDESGHFGSGSNQNQLYIILLVLHDQNNELKPIFDCLNEEFRMINSPNAYFHAGAILRREDEFKNISICVRRKMFNIMSHFTNKMEFKYISVIADYKKSFTNEQLYECLQKSLKRILVNNVDFFTSFDVIKIYYDNGQKLLTKLITDSFCDEFSNVEIKFIDPHEYTLFQVADFISTLELVNINYKNNNISKSELYFFGSYGDFKRNYYKQIEKKKISN